MLRTGQAAAQLVIQYFAEIGNKMGLSGNVLCSELMQISFIELIEIHTLRGSHFPDSLRRALRSISAATANGFPAGHGFLRPLPAGHITKMNVNRCLFHKTQVVWISLQGFGYVFKVFIGGCCAGNWVDWPRIEQFRLHSLKTGLAQG